MRDLTEVVTASRSWGYAETQRGASNKVYFTCSVAVQAWLFILLIRNLLKGKNCVFHLFIPFGIKQDLITHSFCQMHVE